MSHLPLKIPQLLPHSMNIDQYLLLQFYQKYLSDCMLNVSHLWNSSNLLPDPQLDFRNKLFTCIALLTLLHHVQTSLDDGLETILVSLDLSSAFDEVNHKALLWIKVSRYQWIILWYFIRFLIWQMPNHCH